jgi:hypothetical protein
MDMGFLKKALAASLNIAHLVSTAVELNTTKFAYAKFFPEDPPSGIQITEDGQFNEQT